MNITATPDMQAKIILDQKTGDVITAQGSGNLNLKISTLGKFDMTGDYFFTNGHYNFTLENVINKKFERDKNIVFVSPNIDEVINKIKILKLFA